MEKAKVIDYLNYRDFLRDCFQWHKDNDPGFSQKRVQIDLGIASSGFLPNVLAGRKNLTPTQAARLARLLGLDRVESSYFEHLVLFTQARTMEEKNEFFARLMTMQSARLSQLSEASLSLFAKWYYVAVREILGLANIQDDYVQLATLLQPAIKASEAKEAIDVLAGLNLIERNSNGFWEPKETAISTGDEVRSMHLLHFQISTMDLAKRALNDIPTDERDISVLTMGLSPDGFRLAKNEIQHFRKRLAKIAMDDQAANRIFQINFQFFPISVELERKGVKP